MVRSALRRIGVPAALLLLLSGCGAAGLDVPTATPFPTIAIPPTPTVDDQVSAVARTGPAWLDQCPTHTGRIRTGFSITTVPGNVVDPGYCDTFVQRGPHGDLITFRASWDTGKHHTASYVITYLMPRTPGPTGTPTPKIVSQQGEPP